MPIARGGQRSVGPPTVVQPKTARYASAHTGQIHLTHPAGAPTIRRPGVVMNGWLPGRAMPSVYPEVATPVSAAVSISLVELKLAVIVIPVVAGGGVRLPYQRRAAQIGKFAKRLPRRPPAVD